MTEEDAMLAAYAEHGVNSMMRLILADWYEERYDPRGSWLRDAELAEFMGPRVELPLRRLVWNWHTKAGARMLVKVGRHAVPALLAEVGSQPFWPGDMQNGLGEILTQIADGEVALADEIRQLNSPDKEQQLAGLQALGDLGEFALPAAFPIIQLLLRSDYKVAYECARTLTKLGPSAADALLAANTYRTLENERRLASALHDAVVQLGPHSPAVRIVTRDIGASNPNVWESADSAVRALGAAVFEPLLAEAVAADGDRTPWYASALRSAPGYEVRLLDMARDSSRNTAFRAYAIRCLFVDFDCYSAALPAQEWLIPHLIKLADEVEEEIVLEAVRSLGCFGVRAARAAPVLARLVGHVNRDIADEATRLLSEINVPAGPNAHW